MFIKGDLYKEIERRLDNAEGNILQLREDSRRNEDFHTKIMSLIEKISNQQDRLSEKCLESFASQSERFKKIERTTNNIELITKNRKVFFWLIIISFAIGISCENGLKHVVTSIYKSQLSKVAKIIERSEDGRETIEIHKHDSKSD